MGVFFVALIILYILLSISVKSDEAAHQRNIQDMEDAYRKGMGHGRDNIYQFKIYCYNMRYLLGLAQSDGIGVGEERNEVFYDKYRKEISERYCNGRDPVMWCMGKANKKIREQGYICAWLPNKENKTYTALRSEYNRDVYFAERIDNIKLPRDGITGTNEILRALYYKNHASEFENISPYKNQLSYYSQIDPGKKFKKHSLTFEESGITLYN